MRKLKLFFACLLMAVLSIGQMWGALTNSYTKVTSVTDLADGDVVVLATESSSLPSVGVSGQNGTNDAAVSTTESEWVQYEITLVKSGQTITGWTLYNPTLEKYVQSPTGNHFKHGTTGGTCYVKTESGNGQYTFACNSRYLQKNSSYYRMYGSINTSYTMFYVWKVASSCSEDPTVGNIMNNVSNITATGATFTTSAGVSAGSNCSLSEVGFVYGTSSNPTITTGTKATIANYSSGNLSKSVTGLNDNTTYYVRAFATNGHGTVYSDQKSFKTLELSKYTVSFVTGAGNSTQAAITEASVGAGITLPAAPSTIKCSGDGWEFAGWSETNVASETGTAPTLLAASSSYSPNADVTLYAVYRHASVSSESSSVTYTLNGNWTTNNGNWTVIDGALDGTLASNKYGINSGSTSASSPVSITDISSITFSGTKSGSGAGTVAFYYGSGNSWTLIESKSFSTSLTWSPSPTVTGYLKCVFTRTAGNIYMASIGVTGKFPSYTYISSPDCCTELGQINGSFLMSQNSATLNWDLESAQNGGKDHITSWKVEYMKDGDADWTVAENALAKATLTKTISDLDCNSDYSFRVSANVENGYCANAYEDTGKTTQYTITLTGSGTVSGGTFTVKGQSVASVSACDGDNIAIVATRSPGYNFSGWTIAKTAGTVSPAAATASTTFTMPAENVTVTAAFAAQHHDVVFHKNDGGEDETDTQDFTYGVAQNLKTISAIGWTRTNYNFGGWMTTSGGSSADKLDGVSYTLNVESDVDLFALWVADNTRTISYSGDTHIASYSSKPTTVDIENDDEFSVAFTLEDHYTLSSVAVSMGSTPLAANLISFDQSSLTVTAPDGGFTDNISVAFTIAATNYTVNWYVNGSKVHDQTDVFNTDYDEVPDDFSAFTDCSDFHFVGWKDGSAIDGFVTEAPIMAEIGTKITANKNYYAVFADGTPGSTTWTRVTAVNTLTAGGTFILGYEATANSGVIVPMQNTGTLTSSAAGYVYSGDTEDASNSNTINMSTISSTDKYEITVAASETSGAINIKFGDNFLGNENTKNNAKLYTSDAATRAFKPTLGDDDAFTLEIEANTGNTTNYKYLKYNTGSPRFAVYSTTSEKLVFYKKGVTPDAWEKWYTTCPHVSRVTLSAPSVSNGSISFAKNEVAITSIVTVGEDPVTVDVVVASHDAGYGLSSVELSGVDGASYSNGVITIPANAEGTLTATATFAQKNYTVDVISYPAGIGATLTGSTPTAHLDGTINISTTEVEGYLFDGWYLFEKTQDFDIENVDWTNDDLSSTLFGSGKDLLMETDFTMPEKDIVAVAAYDAVHDVAWAISNTPATGTLANVYVKGIVTNIEQIQTSQYYNASYTISDLDANGEPANAYYVYRGKNVGNTNFTNVNQLTEGDEVIVFGTIKTYQGTKEFDQGNYIITNGRTAASLTSVVVSVPDASLVQTDYYLGDAFSYAGFKATAVYNTGYKKDVTATATFNANNAASYTVTAPGTVNVTATWNATTSANYPVTVTVTTKTLESIELSETSFTGYKGIALPKPATVTAHFDDLGVKSTENVTGSAVFDEDGDYSASSTAEQTITVKYTFGPNTMTANYTVTLSSIENTEESAYSVTEARAIIDLDQVAGNDLDLANNLVYVEGIITAKTTNEITIKDVTDATKTIVLYKSTLGTGISSVDVNDRIKALGVLKLYNNTKYEMDEGCEIVWKQPKVSITIANKALSIGNTWTIEATTDPAEAAAGLTYSIKDDGVSSTYVSLNTTTNVITALAEGTATIIAHAEAYDTYAENTVEFTVTVGASVNVVILAQYRGQWYAMKNAVEDSKIKAVAVDYRHGKLFDVDPADQAAITWTRTFSNEKYTFTNGENYLKGGTSTTLSLAEGASGAYQWTWNSTSGYYTTNTSATYRTFLFEGTEFKNYAVSNAKTGTGETEAYSALPVVVESEDIFVTTGYERNVTVGRMGTVCVDHNVPAGMIFGAEVYQLLFWKYGNTYEDCQMVDFEEVTEMEAGKPYLIIPTDTKFTLVYGETTVAAPVSYNGFYGTFDPIAAATDNVLVGKYGIVNNMIQKLGENCYSPANRAYIDLSETYSQADYEALHGSSPAPEMKRVSLGREGAQTPTGMENVETSEQPQKLMINGQLFILHGEKMYDATGRLVK